MFLALDLSPPPYFLKLSALSQRLSALKNGSTLIASSSRLAYLAIEDLITSLAPWIVLRISFALLLTNATTIIGLMYYFTFWPRYICGRGRSLREIFRNPTRNERPPGRSQYRNWRKAKVDPYAYLDMRFYFWDHNIHCTSQ